MRAAFPIPFIQILPKVHKNRTVIGIGPITVVNFYDPLNEAVKSTRNKLYSGC